MQRLHPGRELVVFSLFFAGFVLFEGMVLVLGPSRGAGGR